MIRLRDQSRRGVFYRWAGVLVEPRHQNGAAGFEHNNRMRVGRSYGFKSIRPDCRVTRDF
jgi:hypothetical protein